MKPNDMFKTNNIDDVNKCIQENVYKGKTLFTLFPTYYPKLEIGMEYDVVGKKENRTRIINALKGKNVGVMHIADNFYVFFPASLSAKEKCEIEREANNMARMYDIID